MIIFYQTLFSNKLTHKRYDKPKDTIIKKIPYCLLLLFPKDWMPLKFLCCGPETMQQCQIVRGK